MILLKSLIENWKPYPPDARFGIGAVDSNAAVHFKEISRDTFGNQVHGAETNPWGRYRFRYMNGEVQWSDCPWPPKEVIHRVNDKLEKLGLKVDKHTSIFTSSDEDLSDIL
jgi:hypothetical protein